MSNVGLIGILICAIVFIIFAITKLRLHAFLALSFASVFVALASGVPLSNIGNILERGVGGTLGFLAIIIGSGAILGKMLEISGGARIIATSLVGLLGRKYADVAMMLVGFIAGIPVFVEVGFVLLVPLVFVVSKEMGISKIKIGIGPSHEPYVCALSCAASPCGNLHCLYTKCRHSKGYYAIYRTGHNRRILR